MNNRPMRLLLVEDAESECADFRKCAEEIPNAHLIATTNSSMEALEFVKNYSPEGVILDIELHKGQGSGLDFLDNLSNYVTNFKPIVIVVTNSASKILYDSLHTKGADLIFYKQQTGYSSRTVILELLSLRKSLYRYNELDIESKNLLLETQAEFRNRLTTRINTELDLVGISSHLKGRGYIHDAILYLIEASPDELDNTSPYIYLANKYKKSASSISRVMQTSINYAWRSSSTDDLELYYTAKINYHTGVPSPTELIYYYSNKIKNSL